MACVHVQPPPSLPLTFVWNFLYYAQENMVSSAKIYWNLKEVKSMHFKHIFYFIVRYLMLVLSVTLTWTIKKRERTMQDQTAQI